MSDGDVKVSDRSVPLLRQCFLTAAVALNIAGHGCVIGFSAVLIPSLRLPGSHIHATTSQESWIASIVGVALVFGNIIMTPLMDLLGRKKSNLFTILPCMMGWFMLLLVDSVGGIITARFLQGVAMGMLGPLGSVIIGEMTDPKYRGMFLTSVSLSLTIGVMFSHTLGTLVSWQQTALTCSFVTFTSCVLIIFNPESPAWLISKGRFDEGRKVFIWLRGEGEKQEAELESMIIAQKMARKSSVAGMTLPIGTKISRFFKYLNAAFRKPEFYKPFTIMFMTYTMFQFAGINVISSYAIDIIHQVVGPTANAPFWMVALDVERLICNILAVFLMKTMKRRVLLFSSCGLCILAYLGKAAYVYARHNHLLPFDSQVIPLTLIGLYMFALTVGISSVTFAISGEIFPLEYRGLGGGLGVLGLSFNFLIAVKCFPVLNGILGLSSTYCLYAAIVALCTSVIWVMLPETKDRTLQDIENSFRGLKPADQKSMEPLNGVTNGEMMRRCSSHILY